MSLFIDLTGQRFGRWTCLSRAPSCGKGARWVCMCECGTKSTVSSGCLRSGGTKSCGCLKRDAASARRSKHRGSIGKPRTYAIWVHVRSRVNSRRNQDFNRYGGRGISICERWNDYANFLADMGEAPKGMSLERLDNDKDYEPGNCKWATRLEQSRNTSITRFIEFNGVTKPLTQWAEELGIHHGTLRSRLDNSGWSVEKALTTPALRQRRRRNTKLLSYRGQNKSVAEWATHLGVCRDAIYSRLRKGQPAETVLDYLQSRRNQNA